MFITLEGSEGSGKTSHIAPLADAIRAAGYDVLTTREPGGTPIGEQIRSILFDFKNSEMEQRTEILLFQAARAQHVEQVIRPHLDKGGVVICDRYADSSVAYQGYGYERDPEVIHRLNAFSTCGLTPDITLFLDCDVKEGLQRKMKNGGEWNRLDAYKVAFYERVRLGYLELVRREPQRWVVIDAGKPFQEVQMEIREAVFLRLNK